MAANLWFFYALGAAVSWGLSYALSEKLLAQGVSIMFLMLTTAASTFVVMALGYKFFENDVRKSLEIMLQSKDLITISALYVCAVLVGSFLLFAGIQEKNATLVSLVEITYPLFIVLFTWLFFKTVHFTLPVVLGGLLIMAGVTLIYLKS